MYLRIFIAAVVAAVLGVSEAGARVTRYKIDESRVHQTIDGFGASDAWTMQWVGLWPDSVRSQIARWLFSSETDANGQPEGIALSIWRYNLGGGSQEQGDSSQISSRWNRAESFLLPDGSGYDWSAMAGQRWMLRQARGMGVPVMHLFLNSPHVSMTQNGLATNTGRDSTLNLRPDCYGRFVDYIADVVEGVRGSEGVEFAYVSPFNEPDAHWCWLGPKQEGTPATNREVARVTRMLDSVFTARGIPSAILINESSDYRCMYATHHTGPERGYQIQQFFTPDSADTYVGDIPRVQRLIGGHSYWTNTPLSDLMACRKTLRDTLDSRDVRFWQTELCIMGNDDELNGGWRFDPSMKTALYVARVMHYDLAVADACSWNWWRAAAPDSYKDCLIGLKAAPDLLSGTARDSKLMWAMGNYSRFVRPGARRVQVDVDFSGEGGDAPRGPMRGYAYSATDPVGLMVSAYVNSDGRRVAVVVNYADEDREISFDFGRTLTLTPYLTSKGDYNLSPLAPVTTDSAILVPARSVMTLSE